MLLDTATTPAALFAAFEATYVPGRYASEAEREERFAIFKENLLDIDRLSALNPHATFGVTRFSDRTDDEFASTRCAFRANATAHAALPRHTGVLDVDAATAFQNQSVDWRTKGAVTPVKDQGDCGGCWAFSSTGSIEGQWAIAGNTLVSVSEQELISCDDYFPCSGCSSGEQSCAWQFLKGEHGGQITTEKSYPYVSGATGGPVPKCSISGTSVGATISGYASIPSNEIQMSAWAAQHGPMSVAAYAIPWKQYTSGILSKGCDGAIDHAVLVTGFGSAGGVDYWTIKNSWGPSFGEEGYIRITRGENTCKIDTQVNTATVKK